MEIISMKDILRQKIDELLLKTEFCFMLGQDRKAIIHVGPVSGWTISEIISLYVLI